MPGWPGGLGNRLQDLRTLIDQGLGDRLQAIQEHRAALERGRIAQAFGVASEGQQEPSQALYAAKHRRAQQGQAPPSGSWEDYAALAAQPGHKPPSDDLNWQDFASLAPRAVSGAQKMWQAAPAAAEALWNDPLGSINSAGMAGQAATDAIVRKIPQPAMRFNDPRFDQVKNAADLTMTVMGMSSVVPAEANSLRSGIKALRDIRPPKEDVWETVQGHSTHGTVLGDADVDINKLTGGPRMNDPAQRKRVDALKSQMNSDDGYVERLIVDDSGDVIEGQHRLEALRELGAKHVPATIIRDLGRTVHTNKVEAAVKAAGQTRGEQSRQIVQNVLEMANDVGLDNIASQYTFPRGFEASHQAAIDALKGQTIETAEQVKTRLYANKPRGAAAIVAAKGLEGLGDRLQEGTWKHPHLNRIGKFLDSDEGKKLGVAGLIGAGLLTADEAVGIFGTDGSEADRSAI